MSRGRPGRFAAVNWSWWSALRFSFQFGGNAAHAEAVDGGVDHVAAGCGNRCVFKAFGLRANGHGKGAHVPFPSWGGLSGTISRGYGQALTAAQAAISALLASSGRSDTGAAGGVAGAGPTGCVQLFTRVRGTATPTATPRPPVACTGVQVWRTDLKTTPIRSAQRTPYGVVRSVSP